MLAFEAIYLGNLRALIIAFQPTTDKNEARIIYSKVCIENKLAKLTDDELLLETFFILICCSKTHP